MFSKFRAIKDTKPDIWKRKPETLLGRDVIDNTETLVFGYIQDDGVIVITRITSKEFGIAF